METFFNLAASDLSLAAFALGMVRAIWVYRCRMGPRQRLGLLAFSFIPFATGVFGGGGHVMTKLSQAESYSPGSSLVTLAEQIHLSNHLEHLILSLIYTLILACVSGALFIMVPRVPCASKSTL